MTIINASDLDRDMGRHIDPNSVPKHDGADQGHMQAIIDHGTDMRLQSSQLGNKVGTEVFDPSQVGGDRFYGSATIISVNDAPPLMDQRDPDVVIVKPMPVPAMPGRPGAPMPAPSAPVSQIAPKPPPFVFPKAPPRPTATTPMPVNMAPTPMPAAPPPAVAALFKQMGLKRQP
jgi:hypothetical protein